MAASTSEEKPLQKASVNDVFTKFHETYSSSDMEILCTAYRNLSKYQEIALKALSIKSANSLESVSFTNASVVVDEHLDTWYPIGMIFLTGLKILQAFLQDEAVPEPGKQRDVLAALVTYLLDKGTYQRTGHPNFEELRTTRPKTNSAHANSAHIKLGPCQLGPCL